MGRTKITAYGEITKELISTHSPRVGRTRIPRPRRSPLQQFQLTRPVWGEPIASHVILTCVRFQLTRPVWGEPRLPGVAELIAINFNSLAPCGANRECFQSSLACLLFQLTRPVWGEPFGLCKRYGIKIISTHSPRVGRTYYNFYI